MCLAAVGSSGVAGLRAAGQVRQPQSAPVTTGEREQGSRWTFGLPQRRWHALDPTGEPNVHAGASQRGPTVGGVIPYGQLSVGHRQDGLPTIEKMRLSASY